MIFYTEEQISKLISMKDCVEIVEEVFRLQGKGKVQMPPKSYLYFEDGDLRTMPAYLEDLDVAGVKIVTSHPNNPNKHRMPTVNAIIILNDPKTGVPLVVMDGAYLTSLRTGAVGAVASKYLVNSKKNLIVGMIGAGNQAKFQLLAHKEVFGDRISMVKIFDVDPNQATSLKKLIDPLFYSAVLTIRQNRLKELLANSDIVITTTPSKTPVVKNEWIEEGTHINAIGADAKGKQELDPEIYKRKGVKIIVDDIVQASHSGEINVPLSNDIISLQNIYGELGEIIVGDKKGRESREEITIFDSTGLAIHDIAVANFVRRGK